MKIENTIAQMRKGILELCILSVIHNKESYPSEIIAQLQQSGLIVVEGTVYPLLTRLKNAEFLGYRWEESPTGPPRKYYHITESGKSFYNTLLEHWNTLYSATQSITKS